MKCGSIACWKTDPARRGPQLIMDPTRIAIQNDRVTAVALLVVLAGGVATYQEMERAEDPEFTVRIGQVTTLRPGMSPERVERLITDKIEAAIQEIAEVDFVVSASQAGVSFVTVTVRNEFDDMPSIWDDVRQQVERVAPDLPAGVIGPTVNDLDDIFGILVALIGDGYGLGELKTVADEVRDELLLIDDVAKVNIYGAQAERIYVDYDNTRLAELGLAPLQLRSILESVNTLSPGGDILAGTERISVEPSGSFQSVDQLRRTVVTAPGRSEIVYLEDLAEITRGYVDPPASMVRASGAPALAIGIAMREGGDVTALGEEVTAALDRLQAAYPIGIEFDLVSFQPESVDTLVRSFGVNLLQAVGIVLVVALAFLGVRAGLVVASLVPAAMVMALPMISFFDVGINQVSLAALIISLGMLVDNGIVMAESITVRMATGRPPVEAAAGSAHELRVPLLVSSLTTAAAFLPIYLAESNVGEYTAPLFTVVTATLLSSWILALTVTPLLCVRFLRVRPTSIPERFYGRFYRWYRRLLLASLQHRALTLTAVAGLFVLALQGVRLIPSIFFPPSSKAAFTAEYDLPAGTSIERTMEIVTAIDQFIATELRADGVGTPRPSALGRERREGVTNWVTFVGNRGPRFYTAHRPGPPNPQKAFSILNATSRDLIAADLIPRLATFCREQFPDLETTLNLLSIGPPVAFPVEVRVSGGDQDVLFDIVDTVKGRMRATPGIRQLTDDWGVRSKKLMVEVDQPRARRAGVTSQDIAISLRTALRGFEATQYRGEDEIIPVMLRSTLATRTDVAKLQGLNVHSQATGQAVPLLQVADATVAWEPSTIRRRDRLRTVTVSADIDPAVTASDVVARLRPWLDAEQADWPVGYRYEFGGEEEASVQANRSITEQLPIAALLIVLLLVGQFNSVRRAAIVLLAIPLGLIGVVAGLIVAQSYFGFMTLLGIVALTGIVINNAIILIDRIGMEIERGLDPTRAIFEGTQQRLRPILMTTVTTVASLLPLWFGGGPMWEPMAIAIIFGLLFATALIVVVVPIVYSLFFRIRFDGFKYLRTRLAIDAYPKIDAFLNRFAASLGWSGALVDRIRAIGEETLLILVQQHEEKSRPQRRLLSRLLLPGFESGEATKRPAAGRLLLVARTSADGAAELEFIAATGDANVEDRMALFGQESADVSIEQNVSLRLLRHYATSVRHQQYHDTDVVTVRLEPGTDLLRSRA